MEQSDLLRLAVDTLEKLEIPYMLVGSLASGLYGESRFTNDIDLVVDLKQSQIDALCAAFPAADFYLSTAAALEAIRFGKQFNVIHPASGNKIDFMLARRDEWGAMQLQRRQRQELLPGVEGCVASPEDVILAKLLYYHEGKSEKHLRDVSTMIQIQGNDLDRHYIEEWAIRQGVLYVWSAILSRLQDV